MEQYTPVRNFYHDHSRGLVPHQLPPVKKFGRNRDVDTGGSEAVWSYGGQWINSPVATGLQMVSSDAGDAGALRASGTHTDERTSGLLIDDNATFQTSGVLVGDVVLNDTTGEFGYVTEIISQTRLTFFNNNGTYMNENDTYRIAYTTGLGVGVVQLSQLLDANWDRAIPRFVILDGLTGVVMSGSDIWRLTRMRAVHAGNPNSPFNLGNIDANLGGGPIAGTTIAQIPIASCQTQMACYTTARNEEAYVLKAYSSINRAAQQDAKANVFFGVQAAGFSTAPVLIKSTLGVNESGANPFFDDDELSDRIPPRTDVVIAVDDVTQNDSDVSAGFDLVCYKVV